MEGREEEAVRHCVALNLSALIVIKILDYFFFSLVNK